MTTAPDQSPRQITRNCLLAMHSDQPDADDRPTIHRVCWINVDEDTVGLFDVIRDNALPEVASYQDIKTALACGLTRILDEDTWLVPAPPPADLLDKKAKDLLERSQARQKRAYENIEDLVKSHEHELFHEDTRGRLIQKHKTTHHVSRPFIYKMIRRYYRHGMSPAALASNHGNCGAPGVPREDTDRKRGHPPLPENRTPDAPGVNVTSVWRGYLVSGWERWVAKENLTVQDAYDKAMELYFATGYRMESGMPVPILPPADRRPTKRQFRYWGRKGRQTRRDNAAKGGAREYKLKHRPTLSSARQDIQGPGRQYQVDATGALVRVVSRRDARIGIGTGIVYLLIDTYSSFIPGWTPSLENASYSVLSVALERAFTSKVAICKRLGLETTEDDWPAILVPDEVLGDRGPELVGDQSDSAAEALRFTWSSPSPGRGDQKPYIERRFRDVKDFLEPIPGSARKRRTRGEVDPATLACVTFDELDLLLAYEILAYNHSFIVKDHPDAIYLQPEGLLPTPINLWNWGLKNRSGTGKSFPTEYIRAALMPKANVPATPNGLSFKGLAYSSSTLQATGAFDRGTGHKRIRVVCGYDPRDLSELWLLDSQFHLLEKCPLTPRHAHMVGISLWELEATREAAASLKVKAETHRQEWRIASKKARDEVVKNAKKRQQDAGGLGTKYDASEREREKAARRQETSWTNTDQPSGSRTDAGYDYVPPADYTGTPNTAPKK